MAGFELLGSELGGFQSRRRQGLEKSVHHRLIDLDPTHMETVHAASLDNILAGAMVTGLSLPLRLGEVGDERSRRCGLGWPGR